MANLLDDKAYDEEIERMAQLHEFPQSEAAKGELRRAMRQVSERDSVFIHRLISEVIDTEDTCPTPAELLRRSGEMKARLRQGSSKNSCELCQGTGYVEAVRRVTVSGMTYDAVYAKPCDCRK